MKRTTLKASAETFILTAVLSISVPGETSANLLQLEFFGSLDRVNSLQINDPALIPLSPFSQDDPVHGVIIYETDVSASIVSSFEKYFPAITSYVVTI